MAEDANARIRVDIDTAAALANIKNLQRQISAFHTSLAKSGAAASASSMQMQQSLLNSINKTGQFSATIKNVKTTTDSFTNSLEKNKLSMGEYFRYSGAATKTFGRLFRTEFDTINKVARERVKDLQTQYIKMGRDANGAMRAIAVRPLALDMENLSTRTQIAAQRQALLNQLLKQGSTNLLNFGKNTQWAGRQLMVGFTVPLVMLGSVASKTFMDMEKQAVRFKRVYGEMFTTTEETNKALQDVKDLANEFTKYGVAVEKTMGLAADIAATGKMGAQLTAQVAESTRLAVLGGVEQAEALQATISLTDAFGVSAEQLAGKIDFLNAVENQTITSIEDLTIAIPKAGPVVQQLGGDVEDLTFFLTAMREGGINASEGANALKSGLAALINPTGKAAEMLQEFGINVKGIVEGNAGNVKGLVLDFATALDTLDPLNRARAIEQLFGKFQFSRLSTLFQNVIKEGNQASRVLKLSNSTAEELAILSARELKKVEDSPMFKFQKALEDIKVTLVPIGEAFLKAVTPILEFGTKILKKFDELDEGAKSFVVGLTAIAGVIGPVFLMGFGLIANGVANVVKGFVFFKTAMNKAASSSNQLGLQTEYMTQQQLEASAVAASLDQVHQKLRQTFTSEAIAVNGLTEAYRRAIAAQVAMTGAPITRTRPPKGAGPAIGYASGVLSVPGPKGAGDIVPAMLSPGEAVIPARQAKKYSGFISSMIADNVPGFKFGRNPFTSMLGRSKVAVRMRDKDFISELRQSGKDARYKSAFETGTGADYLNRSGSANEKQKIARSSFERDIFGLDPKTTQASARPTYGYAKTPILSSLVNRIFGGKGKRFNAVTTGTREKSGMERYGNIDLITKNSVAKRSTAFPGDSFINYVRQRDNYEGGRRGPRWADPPWKKYELDFPAMRGASKKDLELFEYRFGNKFGTIKTGERTYNSNLEPPYVETQTPGGFAFREIDKIIARDRATAAALRKELKAAGLGSVRVTGSNFVARLLKKMGIPGYKDGIFSVPGPRGAGDVVPAMLAPGEAVIPADKAKKYRKLIKGMVSGNIPGYEQSVPNGIPVPSSSQAALSAKEYDRTHFFPDLDPNDPRVLQQLRNQLSNQNLRPSDFKDYYKIVGNLTADLPKTINQRLRSSARGIPLNEYKQIHATYTNKFKSTAMSAGATASELDELANLDKRIGSRIQALARLEGRTVIKDELIGRATKFELEKLASQRQGTPLGSLASRMLDRANSLGGIRSANLSRKAYTDPEGNKVPKMSENQTISEQYKKGRFVARGDSPMLYDQKTGARVARLKLPGSSKGSEAEMLKRSAAMQKVESWIKGGRKGPAPFPWRSDSGSPTAISGGYQTQERIPSPARGLAPAAIFAAELDKASRSRSPSEKFVETSAKNIVDGAVKGIEDGKKDVINAGKSVTTAFVDGTERVRVTEKGQFYDRNTKKRISEAEARKTMALDRQNEKRRERAQQVRELKEKRSAGISQTYGISQREYDSMSEEQRKGLRHQRNLNEAKAKAVRAENANARDAEKQRIANARVAAQEKQQRIADRKERISGMGGRVAGGASALGMGAMMYGMSGGPGAQIAGMLSLPLMMAPMLTNKFALMAAAVVGLVAGFVILQNSIAGIRKESAEATKSLGSGKEAMSKFAEMAGTVTGSEFMQRRREMQASPFVVQTGKTTFGQSFIDSEAGAGMLTAFEKQAETFGRSRAIESLQKQLVTAVATGVLSVEQAQSIANSLGQKLNDYGITANINASIQSIVGPDGKVLDGNTIQIYTEFIEGSTSGLVGTGGILQSEEFTNNAGPFWWMDTERVAKQEGEAAGIIANFYDENQQLIDAFDAENLKNIDRLYEQGKYDEALAAEEVYQNERKNLISSYNDEVIKLQEDFANADLPNQQAILSQLTNFAKETDAKFGTAADKLQGSSAILTTNAFGQEVSAATVRATQGGRLTGAENIAKEAAFQQVKVQFLGEIAAGNIDSETFNGLMSMFDPATGTGQATLSVLAKISTQVGPQALAQLENVFKVLDNPDMAADIAIKIQDIDDPEQLQNTVTTLEKLSTFDGKGVEAQVILQYLGENPDELDEISEKFAKLSVLEEKGKLDIQTLVDQKIITTGDMEAFRQDQAYFDSLEPKQQVVYTQVFLSKLKATAESEIAAWKKANPSIKLTDDQIAQRIATATANQYTVANPIRDSTAIDDEEEVGGGSGGPAASPLDDILKKLRDIRKNQVGVTTGFEASAKAINKLFGGGAGINLFSGIENDMRSLGAQEDLINLIVGMDPEEFEKKKNTLFNFNKQTGEIVGFKEQLQNVGRALSAIALGQYVSDQQRSAKESRNQVLAFNQLRAAGYSVAEAYETIQDAAVASAVATGDVTRDQLGTMLQELRNAQAAMKEAARLTPEGLQEVFEEGFNKAMEAFDVKERKLTIEYEFKTKNDQALVESAQNQIAAIQFELDDYQADLQGIEDQENSINDTYDNKLEALEKVRKANQGILDQEQGKLSIAEAITRGDVAGAARAIQELRQSSASAFFSSQTDALNANRQSSLDAVRGANGLSRIEIEEKIKDLTNTIFEIEEKTLEPAQRRIELAQIELKARIDEQTELGKTKSEWEEIKNNIDDARVNSIEYKDAMLQALDVVLDVKNAWAGIQSKAVTLTTIQKTVTEGNASGSNFGGDGSGNNEETLTPAQEAAAELEAKRTAPGAWKTQESDIRNRARIMESALRSVYSSDGIGQLLANYNNASKMGVYGSEYARKAQDAYNALHEKLKARGFNYGGPVSGPGTASSDSIPAMLSDGEYVIRAASVNKFGKNFLDSINAGKLPGFRLGGMIRDGGGSAKPSKSSNKSAGPFQKFEAGFQNVISKIAENPIVKSVGNFIAGDNVGGKLARGAIALISTPVEVMGSIAKNIIDTSAKVTSQVKNGNILGAAGSLITSALTNVPSAITQGTANAFAGVIDPSKRESSMFEKAAKSAIDNNFFGAKTNPEMAALARIVGGTLNLAGDPLTYLGIGAASKLPKVVAAATTKAPMGRSVDRISGIQPLANPNASLIRSMLTNNLNHGTMTTQSGFKVDPKFANPDNWFGANFFTTGSKELAKTYGNQIFTAKMPLRKAATMKILDLYPGAKPIEEQFPGLIKKIKEEDMLFGISLNDWEGLEKSSLTKDPARLKEYLEDPTRHIEFADHRNAVQGLRNAGIQAIRHQSGWGAANVGNEIYSEVFAFLDPSKMKASLPALSSKSMLANIREIKDKLMPTFNKINKKNPFRKKEAWELDTATLAQGGMVSSKFAMGGMAKGTDTVPAMLTPGEFVVKRPMVNKYGTDLFNSINSGSFGAGGFASGAGAMNIQAPSFSSVGPSVSVSSSAVGPTETKTLSNSSVYNYNLSVNVASQSDPNAIAQTVMGQIRSIDSQRIRSNRF
jgi:TP901 family phage tail tape measure protein